MIGKQIYDVETYKAVTAIQRRRQNPPNGISAGPYTLNHIGRRARLARVLRSDPQDNFAGGQSARRPQITIRPRTTAKTQAPALAADKTAQFGIASFRAGCS